MSQKDESEVLDELFGASDEEIEQLKEEEITDKNYKNYKKDELSEIESESDLDNDNDSENDHEYSTEKKTKKKRDTDSIGKDDNVDDKILEARRDFEEALSKLKGGRRKKDADSDSVNYDDMAANFINKMYDALRRDDEAVKAEKPALAKLKMLDEVTEMLTRKHLQEVFLDNQVLDVIKKWLEPNIRGHLSVPSIRKRLLEILQSLPIETVHLRESGIGKIVMFYYQRKSESLEIRKLAEDLITTWSRPILGTSLNYSEMIQNATGNSSKISDLGDQNASTNSSIKRLQSENFKKMARSGALERESGGDQRYRQIINRQKNRKRE